MPFAITMLLAVCHVPGAYMAYLVCVFPFVSLVILSAALRVASDLTQAARWLWNYDFVTAFSGSWRFHRFALKRLDKLPTIK